MKKQRKLPELKGLFEYCPIPINWIVVFSIGLVLHLRMVTKALGRDSRHL